MIVRTLTHWGLYDCHVNNGELVDVTPAPEDPDPSPIGRNLLLGNSLHRVSRPAVRRSYLEQGSGHGVRGKEDFVEVSWDDALDLIANELARIREQHGPASIYGGSYGWASAGRFHHAQSQLHRFLTCTGGHTDSVNAYSYAAAEVILPKVIGHYEDLLKAPTSWPRIIEHAEMMVCFGGLPLRNAQITNGGPGRHVQQAYLKAAAEKGIRFFNISPQATDCPGFLNARWLPVRPGTDVALMLGLAYTLITRDLYDEPFIARYCSGFDIFREYVLGALDQTPKTPTWAAERCGIAATDIEQLAGDMASHRTMISLSWSLSRHQHGEQPYWMGITLAALLGQIGLPGCGIGLGYCVENKVGKPVERHNLAHLPRGGMNSVSEAVPVARIADMLLHPGQPYSFNGESRCYPDIRMIYWAGGNPFHHHQDLNRLALAWQKPETVVCHELVWTATARHADIVLPIASSLEREDIGGAPNEDILVAMKQVLPSFDEARTDYAVFSGLAQRLGAGDAFTEGRSTRDWIRGDTGDTGDRYPEMPAFETFWEQGEYLFPAPAAHDLFADFRADPMRFPLATPDGKIQLATEKFGHATWHTPHEWLGEPGIHRFHLVSHQPASRLHSQLDQGEFSQLSKINGMEPITINASDATELGLQARDTVRVFNDRGSFRAGLIISDAIMRGVLSIATGAWWQPDESGECHAGNPNAVTLDRGTSDIAQGPSALTCLVSIEKLEPPLG
ncbi:MAG: molybdopterin-dependent oxidoreductase [Proteobacteria bacterium]|nr:molybdopterin-dependent oxidoreductase [Pseudomonadota bacterium]